MCERIKERGGIRCVCVVAAAVGWRVIRLWFVFSRDRRCLGDRGDSAVCVRERGEGRRLEVDVTRGADVYGSCFPGIGGVREREGGDGGGGREGGEGYRLEVDVARGVDAVHVAERRRDRELTVGHLRKREALSTKEQAHAWTVRWAPVEERRAQQ